MTTSIPWRAGGWVLGAVLLLAGCRTNESSIVPMSLPLVRVQATHPQQRSQPHRLAAEVRAAWRSEIASRMSARVSEVVVYEGQRVRPGQLLARLDQTDLQAATNSARTALNTAQQQARRVAQLFAEGVIAQREVELAEGQLEAAAAALAAARSQQAYAELRAPYQAVVQERLADPGDLAEPGTALLVLEPVGSHEIVASLDPEQFGLVRVGTVVRFEADTVRGTAEIIALAAAGDPQTHRHLLRARPIDPTHPLVAGRFATIELPAAEAGEPGVSIPRRALIERGELTGVFVVDAGRAALRWVSLGALLGDSVEIRAGLTTSELVALDPTQLRDGQPVEIVP